MDLLFELARTAVGLWDYWIGDPFVAAWAVPIVWQLPGLVIALWCVRSLYLESR